jgi:hypothetical protein
MCSGCASAKHVAGVQQGGVVGVSQTQRIKLGPEGSRAGRHVLRLQPQQTGTTG